jgi:hypothetical protein
MERFQSGRTSIVDEDRSGRLTTSQMADNVEQVYAVVQGDRQITDTDTVDNLDINCESAYSIIHEHLRYHKICARWVPKQLTDEHRWSCMETCMQFFKQYCEDGGAFL